MKKTTTLLLLALLCSAVYGQPTETLQLRFVSEPDELPPSYYLGQAYTSPAQLDASGDGRPDLILTREDAEGVLTHIRVLDGRTRAELWRLEDVPTTLGVMTHPYFDVTGKENLIFADPFGHGKRYAVFYNDQDVAVIDISDNTLAWSWSKANAGKGAQTDVLRLLATVSFRQAELFIIHLHETNQIQVWGKP